MQACSQLLQLRALVCFPLRWIFCLQPQTFKELKLPFCSVRKRYRKQNFLKAFHVGISLLYLLPLQANITLLLSCFFVLVCWPEHWCAFCDAWQTREHLMMTRITEQKIYCSSFEILASFRGTKRFSLFTAPSLQCRCRDGNPRGWSWVRLGGEVNCSWRKFESSILSKFCLSSPQFFFPPPPIHLWRTPILCWWVR